MRSIHYFEGNVEIIRMGMISDGYKEQLTRGQCYKTFYVCNYKLECLSIACLSSLSMDLCRSDILSFVFSIQQITSPPPPSDKLIFLIILFFCKNVTKIVRLG
jgi:hypothetical protein